MNLPRLIDSNGSTVPIDRKLAEGGEGTVYFIANAPNTLAKVYHKPPDEQKVEKLTVMMGMGTPQLLGIAAWPTGLVRSEKGGEVAGFVMPRLIDFDEMQRLYNPIMRLKFFPKATWAFQVRAAYNLAAAFDEVHKAGCLVGDVNQSFAFVSNQALVKLIDCDSFQVQRNGKHYLCEVGTPHYVPPELQGKRLRGITRTENHDRFGLAVLIFQLLFVGRHPYAGIYNGKGDPPFDQLIAEYRFSQGPMAHTWQMGAPPHTPTFADISPETGMLFRRAFERGSENNARPKATDWLPALKQLEQATIECKADAGHKYWKGANGCVWCRLAKGGPEYYYGASGVNTPFAVDEAKIQSVLRRLDAAKAVNFEYERRTYRSMVVCVGKSFAHVRTVLTQSPDGREFELKAQLEKRVTILHTQKRNSQKSLENAYSLELQKLMDREQEIVTECDVALETIRVEYAEKNRKRIALLHQTEKRTVEVEQIEKFQIIQQMKQVLEHEPEFDRIKLSINEDYILERKQMLKSDIETERIQQESNGEKIQQLKQIFERELESSRIGEEMKILQLKQAIMEEIELENLIEEEQIKRRKQHLEHMMTAEHIEAAAEIDSKNYESELAVRLLVASNACLNSKGRHRTIAWILGIACSNFIVFCMLGLYFNELFVFDFIGLWITALILVLFLLFSTHSNAKIKYEMLQMHISRTKKRTRQASIRLQQARSKIESVRKLIRTKVGEHVILILRSEERRDQMLKNAESERDCVLLKMSKQQCESLRLQDRSNDNAISAIQERTYDREQNHSDCQILKLVELEKQRSQLDDHRLQQQHALLLLENRNLVRAEQAIQRAELHKEELRQEGGQMLLKVRKRRLRDVRDIEQSRNSAKYQMLDKQQKLQVEFQHTERKLQNETDNAIEEIYQERRDAYDKQTVSDEKMYQGVLKSEVYLRNAILSKAKDKLEQLEYLRRAFVNEYLTNHKKLGDVTQVILSGCRWLSNTYDKECKQIVANSVAAARIRQLRLNLISDAEIDNIGPTRKQTLAKNSIFTAEDIDGGRISEISGFGEGLIRSLMEWRDKVISTFDASRVTPTSQVQDISIRYRARQQQYFVDIESHVKELESLAPLCQQKLNQHLIEFKKAIREYDQAEADYQVVLKLR